MSVVICMFRGVNLGKRRMKMDALRAMCESLGLEGAQTYVQSGNVVFRTKERNLAKLTKRIEEAIESTFGFQSDTVLRTPAEMRDAIGRNPFAGRSGIVPGKLQVVFLTAEPSAEARKKIAEIKADPEEAVLSGREIFIYYPNGMARPKLNFSQIDRQLKGSWTGRNWNTVTTLLEMAEAAG
jgi:uncharacterized protein (DUF1697 family)